MCIALVHQSLWFAVIIFLESFLSRKCFHIYHNIRYQHRLRGPPQGVSDGKPAKQATNHPENPPETHQALFFTACMSMRAGVHGGEVLRHSAGVSPVPAFFPSENGERGRNLCVAVKRCLLATGKPGFQHVQESGFVDGRQSRYGKSPDDSPHDSPAIQARDLTLESPRS